MIFMFKTFLPNTYTSLWEIWLPPVTPLIWIFFGVREWFRHLVLESFRDIPSKARSFFKKANSVRNSSFSCSNFCSRVRVFFAWFEFFLFDIEGLPFGFGKIHCMPVWINFLCQVWTNTSFGKPYFNAPVR